jgi:hypothetical protein
MRVDSDELFDLAGDSTTSAPPGRSAPPAAFGRPEADISDVFGYSSSWPAGPWVIPVFWLTVVLLAFGVRWLS